LYHQGTTEVLRRIPAPVPVCPPQIPQRLAVRGQDRRQLNVASMPVPWDAPFHTLDVNGGIKYTVIKKISQKNTGLF